MDSGILRNRSTLLAAASILALGSHAAPAFAQAQDATDTGQQASDPGGNVIVVTGFRASLEDALEAKRESNLIIESVTAEDIGKFPDQNVAESLQRLPGIQIDRENGQGSKVRIRGLEQNVTLLNGELFVSGLEVYKVGEGNYLALLSAGAYGFVMASNYNTRANPAEVLVKGSQAEVVRKRQSLKQLWAGESVPKWLK